MYLYHITIEICFSITNDHAGISISKRSMKRPIFVVDFFTEATAWVGSREATPLSAVRQ